MLAVVSWAIAEGDLARAQMDTYAAPFVRWWDSGPPASQVGRMEWLVNYRDTNGMPANGLYGRRFKKQSCYS
jgi:hypothetical protein